MLWTASYLLVFTHEWGPPEDYRILIFLSRIEPQEVLKLKIRVKIFNLLLPVPGKLENMSLGQL